MQKSLLKREFPEALLISTREKADVDRMKEFLRDFVSQGMEETELLVPYDDKQGLLREVRAHAKVIEEKHEETGVRFRLKSHPEALARLRKLAGEAK